MARFRLRFHLQEIDLQRGVTLIGRSEECEVTIEDPLVSRRHARILIEGDAATLEDLGSRNGVKVNGKSMKAPTRLDDGDRVRIGTQEFVFLRVDADQARRARTTGVLRLCAQCKLPYARELIACPSCGATEQTDEETLSGSFGAASQYSWSVQLLIEALEKAESLGRREDAERILRRATTMLEERLVSGGRIQKELVPPLARAAARAGLATGDASWGSWIASFYARAGLFPPAAVSDDLARLVARFADLRETVRELVDRSRRLDGTPPREDTDAMARLTRRVSAGDDTGGFEAEKPTAIPPKNY